MNVKKGIVVALLTVAPWSAAQAESSDDLRDALLNVARQYQQASPEEKAQLKGEVETLIALTDSYLSSEGSERGIPPQSLVDISHQVKQLLNS